MESMEIGSPGTRSLTRAKTGIPLPAAAPPTSAAVVMPPPAPPAHGFFGVKSDEEIQREIGRSPADTGGSEVDYARYMSRIMSITWYVACGGWLLNLLDRCYSDRTHQPRVIGEGRQGLPGVNHLTSLHIITATVDEATKDLLKSQEFVERYYQAFNAEDQKYSIWTLPRKLTYTGTYFPEQVTVEMLAQINQDFDGHAKQILAQLCQDAAFRHTREDRGRSHMEWIGIGLSAFTAVIGAVSSYLGESKSKEGADKITDINYAQIFIGVAIATLIKGLSKSTQMHSKAARNLDVTLSWVEGEIKRLRQEIETLQRPHLERLFAQRGISIACQADKRVTDILPIEGKLLDMHYLWMRTSSGQNSLLESIAKLRTGFGFKETSETVEQALIALRTRKRRGSIGVSKAEIVQTDEMTLKELAALYGCSIFLIHETPLAGKAHCQIINEKAAQAVNVDPEAKEAEEEDEEQASAGVAKRKKVSPEFMLLYTAGDKHYQPLIPPLAVTLEKMKSQLMSLSSVQADQEDAVIASGFSHVFA